MIDRFERFTLSVFAITRYWNKIATEEMRKHGLKGAYALYLVTLADAEEEITAAQLAEMTQRDKADISRAVAVLQEIGVLTALGQGLNEAFAGNYYLINGIIGVLSSIVDNVPLVAGCMGMYPVAAEGAMAVDGVFWQLLAYCAGVGGSMLIIGSAAGVVVMGLEKITFGWYMKKITWIAFAGYLAGILIYWVERTLFFT